MQPLSTELVRQWCVDRKLRHRVHPQRGHVEIARGPSDPPLRFLFWPERPLASLVGPVGFRVPPERAAEVARACNLANASSFMGAWALAEERGELYFRVTLPTRGFGADADGLAFVVQVAVGTLRALEPAFRRVALEGADASAVMEAGRAAAAGG